jgi:cytochrome c oxidase assembly protein subunit 15
MWSLALFTVVLAQYLIGVFTLLLHVPVWLGVLHQAVAMILLGVLIGFIHHVGQSSDQSNTMATLK